VREDRSLLRGTKGGDPNRLQEKGKIIGTYYSMGKRMKQGERMHRKEKSKRKYPGGKVVDLLKKEDQQEGSATRGTNQQEWF